MYFAEDISFYFPYHLSDIEKTMHTLDTVLSYYHAAKDVEAIVKEGYVLKHWLYHSHVLKG